MICIIHLVRVTSKVGGTCGIGRQKKGLVKVVDSCVLHKQTIIGLNCLFEYNTIFPQKLLNVVCSSPSDMGYTNRYRISHNTNAFKPHARSY